MEGFYISIIAGLVLVLGLVLSQQGIEKHRDKRED